MSEFTPAQLDALEDALESLDDPAKLTMWRSQVEPTLAARLDDYAALLQWTREAMPPEEVPPGLLDAVIAEAETAPEQSSVAMAAGAEAAPRPRWWQRWGAVWAIPGVALAGSAAMVLWMVKEGSAPEAQVVARAEPVPQSEPLPPRAPSAAEAPGGPADAASPVLRDDALAIAPAREIVEEEADLRGGAAASGRAAAKRELAGDDRFEQAAPTKARPATEVDQRRAKSKAPPAPMSKKAAEDLSSGPLAAPLEEGSVADVEAAEPAREAKGAVAQASPEALLAHADELRRRGQCGSARASYKSLATHAEPQVAARAYAGLGLCAAAGGDAQAAEKFYAQARAVDPSVAKFIDAELRRTAATKPAASSKNAKMAK